MITHRPLVGALAALLFAAVACSGDTDTGDGAAPADPPESSPSESSGGATPPARAETPGADPEIREVSAEQWADMVAAGMWREGCPVTREQLRRVEINHIDFDGEVARGALVVNADVADSVVRIFTRLYEEEFPIRRMRPVEHYDGDNNASLADDNTAAYNCRHPDQINAPPMESPHANGRAVDINPLENPWMDLRCECWSPSGEHRERVEGPGKIVEGGLVWRLFTEEGWIWENIDVPDYMHFDTGYPSEPFAPDRAADAP
ncbi:M15 family metallopeptidase [Streptomyces radicis]|uniref:M15 family peptidase n=1 Tax=Streptomyces radicis TaxID=1750517 RepID=A0A3A9WBE1_9ACTN|nr:M15 family metallopeptidase [Streptomyces radicis]RKN10120.1 M15 family peptidase [Streptomyces radicis]RKN24462.1 M15 family peptidase [Streptomyces radicis]